MPRTPSIVDVQRRREGIASTLQPPTRRCTSAAGHTRTRPPVPLLEAQSTSSTHLKEQGGLPSPTLQPAAMEAHNAPPAASGAEHESHPMLSKSVTFRSVPAAAAHGPPTVQGFVDKVWGRAAPANNRVSESLDYEPTQNRLFYERMKARKEGKKKLYG